MNGDVLKICLISVRQEPCASRREAEHIYIPANGAQLTGARITAYLTALALLTERRAIYCCYCTGWGEGAKEMSWVFLRVHL